MGNQNNNTDLLMQAIISTASNTHNIPLVNASSAPITGSQVSAGNRYIAYFNKCDNVIQLMSYTPAAPTPAA